MALQLGNISLIAALVFSLSSAVALLINGEEKKLIKTVRKWGPGLAAFSITLPLLLLAYYFLAPNFNYQYVFDRASAETHWLYRLSAMWAGQAGTFLIWAWVILLSALLINHNGLDKRPIREVRAVILLGGAFFTFMSIMAEPFNPTMDRIRDEAISGGVAVENVLRSYMNAGFYVENLGFVDGTGLNPMLQSIYNALHPPLIFFSYGLGFVVFALSLVYLVRGQGDWEAGGRTWARAAWLMMTAAMAVGGLWAYEELAYGGYWTWDPIEVPSWLC
jgi:cytochrome c-type biogenesis protein CcmF